MGPDNTLIGLIGALALGLGVGAAIVQIWGTRQNSRADSPVTKDICIVKHGELDKRFNRMESSMSDGFNRLDHSLERMFDKLEGSPAPNSPLGQVARKKEST